ncbi:MAG: TlpA disulfide reductase family protein [Chitinophagaceae bacterium]
MRLILLLGKVSKQQELLQENINGFIKMKKLVVAFSLAGIVICSFTPAANKPGSNAPSTSDSTINIKAPDFQLKDIDGKNVSLKDYKGKVLVLDFWATWCMPCRESFPSVKMVVDKYANDPEVAFLFIDTREKVDNYPELVKKFLAKTNYPFHVVYDEKGDDGKMDVTFKKYRMQGIPAQYFIDPNGIIRFSTLGFKPGQSVQQSADEITDLIEKTKLIH